MKLAHARDHGLSGLGIFAHLERRIFVGHLLQRGHHLSASAVVAASTACVMTG